MKRFDAAWLVAGLLGAPGLLASQGYPLTGQGYPTSRPSGGAGLFGGRSPYPYGGTGFPGGSAAPAFPYGGGWTFPGGGIGSPLGAGGGTMPGLVWPLLLGRGLPGPGPSSQAPAPQGPNLNAWPSWIRLPGGGGAPPNPKRCLLVRIEDQVLVRPAGEKAFYPLAFHDPSRLLEPGAEVRLTGRGRAVLVFADGARVGLIGSARLAFAEGGERRLGLSARAFRRMDVRGGSREIAVSLPGGARLTAKGARFTLRRPVAPAEVGPRPFTITNWGGSPLVLTPPPALGLGPRKIPAYRRVELVAPAGRSPAGFEPVQELATGGLPLQAGVQVAFRREGALLSLSTRGGQGRVRWGGVVIDLPAGGGLRLDPLAGRPFGRTSPPARGRSSAPSRSGTSRKTR